MSEKSEPEQFRKLFVFGLHYETTEEALKSHFEQWGEIVDCVVMRKMKNSNKSRGFGFITYKRAHMVDDAQAARPHKVDGREIKSKRAVPREDSNKPNALVTVNKLYVSGIKDDLTEDDLRDYFGSYGNILSVNIVVDKSTGKRRGFAFVEFDDHDPVDKICLHRHNYKGRRLEVKKALSRDEMNKIKMKQEMSSYGRGGMGGGGGEWRTPDEFDRGGYGGGPGNYGGGYGNGYGGGYGGGYASGGAGGWNDSYGDSYYGGSSGGGGGWGSSFGSSYGGGPMRSSTGFSQRSQGPYGGGRGSGRYGRR